MAGPTRRAAGALLMELPSRRKLVYRNARVEDGRIIYWGVDQYTRQWCELDTYGGKLVENATQAVARELLAGAMVSLEREFPDTLLTTVHDEIVAMTKTDDADELFTGMKLAMSAVPAWGRGLPLSCAGGIVERYGKL
jgi:DNA polymerase